MMARKKRSKTGSRRAVPRREGSGNIAGKITDAVSGLVRSNLVGAGGGTAAQGICSLVIEAGMILLVILVAGAPSSITAAQSIAALAVSVALTTIIFTGRLEPSGSVYGRVGVPLAFAYAYSLVRGRELILDVGEDKTLSIPFVTIILLCITLAWMVKTILKGAVDESKNGFTVSLICAAGVLSLLAGALHVALSAVYFVESGSLMSILSNVLQLVILYALIANYMTKRGRMRRASLYILGAFLVLTLVKGLSGLTGL